MKKPFIFWKGYIFSIRILPNTLIRFLPHCAVDMIKIAIPIPRSQLNRAVTESHDEIADLKEKMKVLTHQFDQMKEEIVAKVILEL